MSTWLDDLETAAPDVVACYRALDSDRTDLRAMRRELRRRAGIGSAPAILLQQNAVAEALAATLNAMPDEALRAPGGEEDWNVAQAFAHTTRARRGLPFLAALSARGEWPAEAPPIIPGVPGPADADRQTLLMLLDKSRRSMAESAQALAGHESEPCPLDHPLLGRLRCGEWLLFAGVHDLMHLEQLGALAARA